MATHFFSLSFLAVFGSGIWDCVSGSGIIPIPDHGSRGQITTGFRIHNTGLFSFYFQDKALYLKLFSILLENGHGMREDHEDFEQALISALEESRG
jgi:hypothetical protein